MEVLISLLQTIYGVFVDPPCYDCFDTSLWLLVIVWSASAQSPILIFKRQFDCHRLFSLKISCQNVPAFFKIPPPASTPFSPTNPTFAPGYVYLSWLRIRGCPAGTFCKVASRRMIDKDNFIPDLITGDNADMIMMTHRQGGGCMKFRGFSTFSA